MAELHLSVLVPTYRRPADLQRCLAAIAAQSRRADEIIVVCRADDEATRTVLDRWASDARLTSVNVARPGVVAALNAGLERVTGDIVAITDDDAAPRPDWLLRIEEHFLQSPEVGGLGGRDFLPGWDTMPGASRVGMLAWFGRQIGNHHLGIGGARYVHMLKGVNMSFRVAAIDRIRFDERLRGSGAQVHNELAFSLAVRRKGWKLLYDPAVAVDHYPAARFDEDQRSAASQLAIRNSAFNETLTLLEHLPKPAQIIFLGWALLIGARDLPGCLQAVRLGIRRDPAAQRFPAVLRGRLDAIEATYFRSLGKVAAF
jgi:glycosyltransferase involved in cell wall biosynthesis